MTDRNENLLLKSTDRSNTVQQAPYKTAYNWYNNNDIRSNGTTNVIKRDPNHYPPSNNHQRDRTNSNYRLPRKAPIVGWQNGSPTVFPSTPCGTPDPEMLDAINLSRSHSAVSSTKYSEIGANSFGNTDTEDLSSLAGERLLQSTPARTIDRSVESLSPDKDTFLTTSPEEFGRSKDLSLPDDIEDKIDLLSPGTDCTEDRIPPTPVYNSYLTSPNLTIGPSPTGRTELIITVPLSGEPRNCRYSESRPIITSNPGYRDDDTKDSIDSDSASDDELTSTAKGKRKPKVPDGGWGWVVVLASLVISMIADGVSFSFGLLYIEFLHEFGASKSKTAWIGSLFMAVPLLSGPIMSALVDRYGCRSMTIIGGLISGTGFVLSSFGNSIEVMYLTFGVIAGLGLGLCYVTAVVSIAYWFDKKRNLAVGLGACGTGIGTFVYAPMTTYFIEEYSWRGTCLLLAGTFFNMIVCGTVMRDPEWWIIEQEKQNGATPRKSTTKSECDRSSVSPVDEFPGVEELRRMLKSGHTPEYLLQILSTTTEDPQAANGDVKFRSVVNLPTFVKHNEKVPVEVLESLSSNPRLYKVILENYPNLLSCRSCSDKMLQDSTAEVGNKSVVTMSMRIKQAPDEPKHDNSYATNNIHSGSACNTIKNHIAKKISKKESEEVNPLLTKELEHTMNEGRKSKSVSKQRIGELNCRVVRTDSLPWLRKQFNTNTHYFKDIRVHRNSVMYRGAALNLHKYRLRASSCPDIYRNSMTTLAKENEEKWYSELVDLLKGMMDFSMFLELHFLFLSLSTILLFTWFIVPYFYLAEHLTRNSYTESDAANLLSIIGITNTIGMIGLGWAGDQPWMNVSKTYTWCLVACGVATILMSILTPYYNLLMVVSAAFGLFFASSFSFTPVILVELIPLERFTTAYGLSLLCQGIGNLLGPPLAGWIFDVTNSWDLSFCMAGGWIIISGFLVGLIPYTKNRKIWGKGPIEMEREKDSIA
ncbi:Monocarboxylate transporter 12 [Melipona quadrifasciata]|uniref:Monocarboxylate transporter 12 n=1 Tax=Melipona quadrifasciata TaxID=166423 RepID=A0A0M9A4Z2_9HYME|nr:Monocarboxylate transporter 12 [Melipona quadrifasciata]